MGMQGYLATVTSNDENNFIRLNLGFQPPIYKHSWFGWLGGYEPNDDGVWMWADGPEAGMIFPDQKNHHDPTQMYANWIGAEPNDGKPLEDYLMMNLGELFASVIGNGSWADASLYPSSSDPVRSAIVEYSAMPVSAPATLALMLLGMVALLVGRKKSAL